MILPRDESFSIIVPIYNKIEIVYDCIRQNADNSSGRHQWIFIDNGSEIETRKGIMHLAETLRLSGHTVKIITEAQNTGVAKAWNKGLQYSTKPHVLILNNDCVLQEHWDRKYFDFHKTGRAQIISAFIFEPGDMHNLQSQEEYKVKEAYLRSRNTGRFREGLFVGITIFGPRHVFEKVGKFDEEYWLSMEETDFLLRAMQIGISIGLSGDIIGFHYSSVTRKSVSFDHNANAKYFCGKHGWDYGAWQARAVNKIIRSWQKRVKYYFGKLSEVHEILPISHIHHVNQ